MLKSSFLGLTEYHLNGIRFLDSIPKIGSMKLTSSELMSRFWLGTDESSQNAEEATSVVILLQYAK